MPIRFNEIVTAKDLLDIQKDVKALLGLVTTQNSVLLNMINSSHPALVPIIAKFINLNTLMNNNLLAIVGDMHELYSELVATFYKPANT